MPSTSSGGPGPASEVGSHNVGPRRSAHEEEGSHHGSERDGRGKSGYVANSSAPAEHAGRQASGSAAVAGTTAAGPEPVGRSGVDRGNASASSEQRPGDRGTVATAGPTQSAGPMAGPVPMNNYAFFVKYTYSNECALLAYNFHEIVTQLGIFDHFTYRHDHRLISVTLAYIFYRYQVHHCDMALDLAVTLVYLEDVKANFQFELHEHNKDAFNLICYLAFLAHAFNADRTIRLSDWYREIGWRSFRNCQQLNGYVFFLFSQVRRYRLRVSETRVKRYIQRLCSVPSQINDES
mmetsp:Transcript_96645/g.181719  ORF Transcript_96645/g.181719 Transcript_96645/m.181719 type:complete len:293 (-) Transcript_96645:38-916(-)